MVTALAVALLVGLRTPVATVVLAGAAVLTGQLSVGWSNDWFDAERDEIVGRTDKPLVSGLLTRGQLGGSAIVAAGACAGFSWWTGVVPGMVHVLAVASAWAYNAGLKGSVWSWAPYAISFSLLPVFLVLAVPGRHVPVWLWLAGGLLGTGAHVANVLPDLEDDAVTGIRGLPHRLGRRGSSLLAPVLLAGAAAVVTVGPAGAPGPVRLAGLGVCLLLAAGAGAISIARRRSRLPFTLSMLVAAVCVLLLVLAGARLG
jgi:4-hydroxybenzoate polyprenyltransferase